MADDLKAKALSFLKQPAVATLAGLGVVTVVIIIRGIRR